MKRFASKSITCSSKICEVDVPRRWGTIIQSFEFFQSSLFAKTPTWLLSLRRSTYFSGDFSQKLSGTHTYSTSIIQMNFQCYRIAIFFREHVEIAIIPLWGNRSINFAHAKRSSYNRKLRWIAWWRVEETFYKVERILGTLGQLWAVSFK